MRLNAYLARSGVASRRKADDLIKAGRVTVNGELGQLNTFVESRDRVEVDGTRVAKQPLAYLLLNKPGATVTTASDPQGRPTVVQLGHVRLLDAVARVCQPMRELTVVREQEHTGRAGVESTHGHDTRRTRHELDDGRPTLRVARGGDDARRLVQQDVRELLLRDTRPVHLDHVARLDERVQLPGRAVDGDAAGLDQLVGLPPRGDAGETRPRIPATSVTTRTQPGSSDVAARASRVTPSRIPPAPNSVAKPICVSM